MDLTKCVFLLLLQMFAQSQLDKPKDIGLMVQDALVIFIPYVFYYLVCDANCKTCATSAVKCTGCNDGYMISTDKCIVNPNPGNSTGTGNQTT